VAAGYSPVGYYRVLKLPHQPLYAGDALYAYGKQLRQFMRGVPHLDLDLVAAQASDRYDRVRHMPHQLLHAGQDTQSYDL